MVSGDYSVPRGRWIEITMSKSRVSVGRPPGIERSPSADGDCLSIGNVCHVLQNERRRLALSHLREADGPLRTSELAEAVAATENDTTPDQLDHSERKRVYISLYQVHLPTLDDADIVRYDSDRGTIEPLPAAERLYDTLDCIAEVTSSVDTPRSAAEGSSAAGVIEDRRDVSLLVAGIVALVGFFLGIGIGSGTSSLVLWSVLGPAVGFLCWIR